MKLVLHATVPSSLPFESDIESDLSRSNHIFTSPEWLPPAPGGTRSVRVMASTPCPDVGLYRLAFLGMIPSSSLAMQCLSGLSSKHELRALSYICRANLLQFTLCLCPLAHHHTLAQRTLRLPEPNIALQLKVQILALVQCLSLCVCVSFTMTPPASLYSRSCDTYSLSVHEHRRQHCRITGSTVTGDRLLGRWCAKQCMMVVAMTTNSRICPHR